MASCRRGGRPYGAGLTVGSTPAQYTGLGVADKHLPNEANGEVSGTSPCDIGRPVDVPGDQFS